MGIKGLMPLLRAECPNAIRSNRNVEEYCDKVIAIDASIMIHQILCAIDKKGMEYGSTGEEISLLQGVFGRMTTLLCAGVKPIVVFDGVPPIEKRDEIQKRQLRIRQQQEKKQAILRTEQRVTNGVINQSINQSPHQMLPRTCNELNNPPKINQLSDEPIATRFAFQVCATGPDDVDDDSINTSFSRSINPSHNQSINRLSARSQHEPSEFALPIRVTTNGSLVDQPINKIFVQASTQSPQSVNKPSNHSNQLLNSDGLIESALPVAVNNSFFDLSIDPTSPNQPTNRSYHQLINELLDQSDELWGDESSGFALSPGVSDPFFECEELLHHMNIAVIHAPGEAEAQCAELVKFGIAYAVCTEDMDALPFGAERLLRHFTGAQRDQVIEIHLPTVLHDLGLSLTQFIDMCVLCGCDYSSTIPGIGPKTALKMIREYKSMSNVLKALEGTRFKADESRFRPKEAARLFVRPDVTPGDQCDVEFNPIDDDACTQYLVNEKGLPRQLVCETLHKVKTSEQVRLVYDQFRDIVNVLYPDSTTTDEKTVKQFSSSEKRRRNEAHDEEQAAGQTSHKKQQINTADLDWPSNYWR